MLSKYLIDFLKLNKGKVIDKIVENPKWLSMQSVNDDPMFNLIVLDVDFTINDIDSIKDKILNQNYSVYIETGKNKREEEIIKSLSELRLNLIEEELWMKKDVPEKKSNVALGDIMSVNFGNIEQYKKYIIKLTAYLQRPLKYFKIQKFSLINNPEGLMSSIYLMKDNNEYVGSLTLNLSSKLKTAFIPTFNCINIDLYYPKMVNLLKAIENKLITAEIKECYCITLGNTTSYKLLKNSGFNEISKFMLFSKE